MMANHPISIIMNGAATLIPEPSQSATERNGTGRDFGRSSIAIQRCGERIDSGIAIMKIIWNWFSSSFWHLFEGTSQQK
jgi:hypothetical protein